MISLGRVRRTLTLDRSETSLLDVRPCPTQEYPKIHHARKCVYAPVSVEAAIRKTFRNLIAWLAWYAEKAIDAYLSKSELSQSYGVVWYPFRYTRLLPRVASHRLCLPTSNPADGTIEGWEGQDERIGPIAEGLFL